MKSKIILGMAAAIVTNLTLAAYAGEDKEVKITFDQVPAAVQAAVKAYATEAEITGIEDSDADGTKVIEFDIKKADKSFEVAFLKDGKLFSTEEVVAMSDLPEAVQKAIAKKGKKSTIGKPEKVTQGDKISYEVVIEKKGKKTEYTFAPDGKITDKEAVGNEDAAKEKDEDGDKKESGKKGEDKDHGCPGGFHHVAGVFPSPGHYQYVSATGHTEAGHFGEQRGTRGTHGQAGN